MSDSKNMSIKYVSLTIKRWQFLVQTYS